MRTTFLLAACYFILTACGDQRPADSVILGKTWTSNPVQPWAEGLAVAGDSIVAVGDEAEIRKWIGKSTVVVETQKDQLIVPGFIDCHMHFVEGGLALSSVQLRDAKTPAQFIQRIKDFAKTVPPGTWITSGDWDHENWGGELPRHEWIDSVTRDNPVWINRLDGHMCLANAKAMDIAGLAKKLMDVPGGTIVRDGRGNPTGIFKDNAMELINSVVPAPTELQEDNAIDAAMAYLSARGVTSLHNMTGFIPAFERARSKKKLRVRIYAGMPLSHWRDLLEKINREGRGDEWLRFGVLKEYVDGSLGSHTASFFKPFEDSPKDSGFFVIPTNELFKRINSADSAGLQLMVHAIGDKAIHTLLNIYDSVARRNGARDRRFRIEHAQHISQKDIHRFAAQNIIPSMQPYHAIDDGRWADKVIGHERAKTTYAFKSMIESGARLAFGSDWFVAPATPLEGIYAAVTRRTLDEKNPDGWIPEQKITVEQAMTAYTSNAAFASFEENIKGSLEKGKLADVVVIDRDITSIDPALIKEANVIMTMVGGQIVYKK